MSIKKLIEVALPLEKINEASAREKSIRHGHPSTLHLWWARRPLATARAVIWASLVDDPSSHPDLFPTEADQDKERKRLFKILEELVVWENSNNDSILKIAKKEILKCTGDNPPELLDPFAGGGAIPLEAQRLGLKSHAHDLNPIAVTINRAMIDIPARFSNMQAINPEAQGNPLGSFSYDGAIGLAKDVQFYGDWLKKAAFEKVGHLYPKVKVRQGTSEEDATVIAWIWSRTVKCPNPACGCNMPLANGFDVSKKNGHEAWVHPVFDYDKKSISYEVRYGKNTENISPKLTRGAKFKCIMCGEVTSDEYIKEAAMSGKMDEQMLCVVAEGENRRLYLSPDLEQINAAEIFKPDDYPDASLPYDPRNIWCVNYGVDTYDKLFTNRQLTTLMSFCNLLPKVRSMVEEAAIHAGMSNDHIPLYQGGKGALAYAEAVSTYLAFGIDKLTDVCSKACSWISVNGVIRNTFARQAIPLVWDFTESNPFSSSTGSFSLILDKIVECIEKLPASGMAFVKQFDAQSDAGLRGIMVSTDPPYYDNISYANLSDYFYVWMRKNLGSVFPDVFGTMLVPKKEELIASPYRFEGDTQKAKSFFETGMQEAFSQVYKYVADDIPVTIYYAFKQDDAEENVMASTGWETILTAIINAGFSITGTWPMRTEKPGRTIGNGTNALASSIVLVCRKRPEHAASCTRRNFINELKRELRPALQKLQGSNIAPVDLAQSAIGPGMGVYSKYTQVLEANGLPMTVRSALQIINQELDLFFNEQDGELDKESRFCIDLYSQIAFNEIPFGDANTLATAKNTAVAIMVSHGVLYAQKGKVHLIERAGLPTRINEQDESIWLLCQQLTYKMEKGGIEGCAATIANMYGSNAERAKDLAYRLYTIAERKKWAQEAYAYNALVVAWPEIQSRAAELKATVPQQLTLEDFMNNNN